MTRIRGCDVCEGSGLVPMGDDARGLEDCLECGGYGHPIGEFTEVNPDGTSK